MSLAKVQLSIKICIEIDASACLWESFPEKLLRLFPEEDSKTRGINFPNRKQDSRSQRCDSIKSCNFDQNPFIVRAWWELLIMFLMFTS